MSGGTKCLEERNVWRNEMSGGTKCLEERDVWRNEMPNRAVLAKEGRKGGVSKISGRKVRVKVYI